jgi:protocatechuate 3,4-dioxygenase beta subunit
MRLLVIATTAAGCRPSLVTTSLPANAVACAPTLQKSLRIEGTVRDTAGLAIAGAQVHIRGTCLQTSTDSRGRYSFTAAPVGRVAIQATYIGYHPQLLETQTDTAQSRTAFLDFVLAPAPPCCP